MARSPDTLPAEAPLMLSVSGARGIVGRSMTPAVAAEFAAAFGSFVKETSGRPDPVICLGRDPRPSGEMLGAAALAGLASVGARVLDLGVVTTPTVGVMVQARGAQGGLVVTASHNPIAWNGLKCVDESGAAPPPTEAREILRRFEARAITPVPVEQIRPVEILTGGHETHIARILEVLDPEPIRAAGFRVVLDSVNGAGCAPGRMLLEALGCEIRQLNGEPNGRFAHPPEPLAENLTELAGETAAFGADCGFAQDPDADRLAIVDETGRFIGEEYTLVLAARQLLETRGVAAVTANLSTSRMIDDLVARHDGARVMRSAVGEANVTAMMREAGAGGGVMLGGEGNGGVIYPEVCWIRDSLAAMALVLSLRAREGRPIGAIVDDLPRYAMIKQKRDTVDLGGPDAVTDAMRIVADHFGRDRVNDMDGVRVDLDDGWVHLRPSNTEPIVRLIAEARTEARARDLIDEVASIAGLDR